MQPAQYRRWRRPLLFSLITVLFVTFLVWLVLQLAQGDLDRGDKLASLVSMTIAATTLCLTVFAIVTTPQRTRATAAPGDLAARLDSMVEILTIAVRTQWEAEEQIRRIHDPFPLQARWTGAPEHLMDHWQNIHGSPDRSDRMSLAGRVDGDILQTFERIPSGRLVVLGKAGAGKTIFAARFTLSMITQGVASATRQVPVIFSFGSWNPTTRSLRDWLCDQLILNYPALAEEDAGNTIAFHLLTTGRVLPVLDGFDEIPSDLRIDAIQAINASLHPGDRFLLTSRFDEYAAAVALGDVLTGAAVVRIEDLTVEDLARYLPLTTRKCVTATTDNKWQPVLDYLRGAAAPTPLATVLTTPLMVALARSIYSDTDANPADLIDSARPDDVDHRRDLEDRLLAGFVPAVYSRQSYLNSPERGLSIGGDKASRWLGFLALHLKTLNSYDFAWWQLVLSVPRLATGLVAGFVISSVTWLVVGMVAWFGAWDDDKRSAWLTAGVLFAIACGVVGGSLVGSGRGIRRPPSRTRVQLHGRTTPVTHGLMSRLRSRRAVAWLVVWAGGGSLFGAAATATIGSAASALYGLGAGLVIGFGMWFVVAFVRALGTPVRPTETTSPVELLRTDRVTALSQIPLVGLGGSFVLWFTIRFAFEPVFGLRFGAVFSPSLWLTSFVVNAIGGALIWALFVTAWGPWLIARTWFPLIRRLPLPIMAFLADAHRRGVLRQSGGVYQFRHARLQDYLARTHGFSVKSGGARADRKRSTADA